MAGGVEYQVTKVDPTNPETKGMVYQVHKVSEEVAATLGGKVYRARIIKDPSDPTVAGKVYQIVLVGDPDDPAVKGKVYNAILTGGSEAVIVGPGVSPLDLDNAVAEAIDSLIAYGGIKQGLPNDYTQLDYIESSGTQYIDTGVIPNQDTSIETKAQLSASSGVRFFAVYGPSSNAPYYGVGFSSSGKWVNQTNTTNQVTNVSADTNLHTIYKNKNILYVDGAQIDDSGSGDFTSSYSIYLLAANIGGSASFISAGKIYYTKIWDGNILVRNFIPCKNASNVVGMYDTVNGVFYGNAGSGSFVAGNAAVPTPTTPVDIVCNNGTLKFSPNEANYIANNVTCGYWLRNSDGQPEASVANFYTAMMPIKPNTSYVAFGRTKDTDVISGYNRIAWYDSDGVWIRNSTYTANTPGIDTSPANAAFARFHCNPSGATVTQELVDSYNWVFQIGAAEVPYIPYSAVNPYVEGTQEIIVVTHNEFDPTDESFQFKGYIQNTTVGSMTRLVAYDGGDKCLIFPVKAGDTYRFTRPTNVDAKYDRIRVAASVGKPVASVTDNILMIFNLTGNTSTPSGTFTIPEGYDYIAINVRNSGAVGTDWQTYLDGVSLCNLSEPSATCENLFAIGDYVDSQDVISGEVTRKVGVLVCDGTEQTYMAAADVFRIVLPGGKPQDSLPGACTHYIFKQSASTPSQDKNFAIYRATYDGVARCCFGVRDTSFDSLASFQAFLTAQYVAGTPVIILYPLAEETTETVTGQPIETVEGDNVAEITQASIDGLELEVEYEKEVD